MWESEERREDILMSENSNGLDNVNFDNYICPDLINAIVQNVIQIELGEENE